MLVAVSGGADSVALLRSLLANHPSQPSRLIVAHFNHLWRAEESNKDAAFVENLASQYGVPFVVDSAEAESESSQTEATARALRYSFLERAAEKHGARYLATGHTADDQAETVLHRIVRGTGIRGLIGIPRIRVLSPAVTIVRPLLDFRRSEVESYLAEIDQTFCMDSSNENTSYTRNRIRLELLPQLEAEFNPDTTGALLRLADFAREYQQLTDEQVGRLTQAMIIEDENSKVTIDTDGIEKAPRLVAREFFVSLWKEKGWPRQAMGRDDWQSILRVVESTQDTVTLPGKIECRKRDGRVTLKRLT